MFMSLTSLLRPVFVQVASVGEVVPVKILGCMALIDEGGVLSALCDDRLRDFGSLSVLRGHVQTAFSFISTRPHSVFTGETDWKILVIDVRDPLASQLNGKPRKVGSA